MKYVWLNMNTGEFSNSWDEKEQKEWMTETAMKAGENNWKLIAYECSNDKSFEFSQWMQIFTAKQKQKA